MRRWVSFLALALSLGAGSAVAWLAWRLDRAERALQALQAAQFGLAKGLANAGVAGDGTEFLFRMHGSNTIGDELAPALAAAYLRTLGPTGIPQVRRRGAQGESLLVAAGFPGQAHAQGVEILAKGTALAFADLPARNCELGMASHRVKDEDAAALVAAGFPDPQSPACEHVIGLDGIAVIVNPRNPLVSLTLDQVAAAFSGRIADWSGLGLAAAPLRAYIRDAASGTRKTFQELVLGGAAFAASATTCGSHQEIARKVAEDPDGIGFVALPYVGSDRALALSGGGGVPVPPSAFTVRTEEYPLTRRLYLYAAPVPNPFAAGFLRFALSDSGQALVEKSGFVSLGVAAGAAQTVGPDLPDGYAAMARRAMRLSVDFRFHFNSYTLDSRAISDLDRLAEYLLALRPRARRLYLVGFTDGTGDPAANIRISTERARRVAAELLARQPGLRAERIVLMGLGDSKPLASNATPDGRYKNRRVEVWLDRGGDAL